MTHFTLQEVINKSGLSEHTLRYYERVGLLEQINRDHSSGHRRYTADDLRMIELISCLRATGMSINHMRRFVELVKEGEVRAPELVELFETQRQQLELELARKQQHLRYLALKVEFWKAVVAGDMEKTSEIHAEAETLAKQMTK